MSLNPGLAAAGTFPQSVETAVGTRAPLRAVRAWLWLVAGLIILMVVVGGATRLTESGLSITQWEPLIGAVPPLTTASWEAKFQAYRQIPQFALHTDMTLAAFKAIFFWEWTHRLIGRLLGLAILVPLVAFWVTGRLSAPLKLRSVGLLLLVAIQGAVGWWMVKSGLADRTEVSQVRLATHLLLATFTLGYVIWTVQGLKARGVPLRVSGTARLQTAAAVLLALVFCQIGLGALVAGLRAGLVYNTWPLMGGRFIPSASELFANHPLWSNFYENLVTVQLQHRLAAYALLVLTLVHAFDARRNAAGSSASRRATALAGLVLCQVAIGISALILTVPLGLALAHQLFAMAVFAMAVVHVRALGQETAGAFANA